LRGETSNGWPAAAISKAPRGVTTIEIGIVSIEESFDNTEGIGVA
jgi:hypothetical protein